MISFNDVMNLTRKVSSAATFSDEECAALYDLCCGMQPTSVVVEIGCQLGRTSSIIAQVGKAIGYRSIHIDPYTSQLEYLHTWIEMMHGIGSIFTLMCMRTDQARMEWPPLRKIDMLLIDGDHTTDGVLKDCAFADEFVRRWGIVAAHDFNRESWPEVEATLSARFLSPQWSQAGVYDTLGVWRRC